MSLRLLIFIVFSFTISSLWGQNKKPAQKTVPAKATINKSGPVKATVIKPVSAISPIAFIYEDVVLDKSVAVKKLDADIKKLQEAKQQVYNEMAIQYQTLYLEYQNSLKNLDSMTTEKLNAKLKAVQESKAKAEDFQRASEKEVQELMGSGIQEIRKDLDKAVKEVAAQKKYPMVIRRDKNAKIFTPGNIVLYAADAAKHDLTEAVVLNLNAKK